MEENTRFLDLLYKPDWDISSRTVFSQLYSCFLPKKQIESLLMKFKQMEWLGDSLFFIIEIENDQIFKDAKIFCYCKTSGETCTTAQLREWTLPPGTYAILTTQKGLEAQAKLDRLSSLIRIAVGNYILFDKLVEGHLSLDTGETRLSDDTTILPSIHINEIEEGVFNFISNFLSKSNSLPKEQKARFDFGLQLLSKAMSPRQKNKFFYYWSAVEAFCDGFSKHLIRNKLMQTYSNKNNYVEEVLSFRSIWDCRTDCFHNGLEILLDQETEHYLQCMVLDILEGQLHLNKNFHMLNMITKGYNTDQIRNPLIGILDVNLP